MKVFKFGGTSMGSASNMRSVAEIITSRGANVTVLSAMSGTTDTLVEICNRARKGGGVGDMIEALRAKYRACIDELLGEPFYEALEKALKGIADAAVWWQEGLSDKYIVAQGEIVTSAVFARYMAKQGHKTVLLDALEIFKKDVDGEARINIAKPEKDTYYITQGFVCTDAQGNIDNFGRGGSDFSAALIGAEIGAEIVEIWTDIDGMHNNDPRFVTGTRPIRAMSFEEAAELAYFGAKILHPATIIPCREKGIPVALKNTMDPDAAGTIISDKGEITDGRVHAVAAKDGITVVRLASAKMLMVYGFLRRVFEIFERHRTAIDMVTTSEVAVALTIDNDSELDKIIEELSELGDVEAEGGNTIVGVVGDLGYASNGIAAQILGAVELLPVKMISYGASRRSLAMLVKTEHKKQFLQLLNDRLF